MKKIKDEYVTDELLGLLKSPDLSLATTLVLLDQKLLFVEDVTRKSNFVFESNETVKKLVEAYYEGMLLVNPKKFWTTRQIIKRMLTLTN